MRELETHATELVLSLVTQHIAAISPEGRDGPADGGVGHVGLLVDVAGVRDLARRRALGAVDLGVRERAQRRQPEARGERVDARVPQDRVARAVRHVELRVGFECGGGGGRGPEEAREVFARVEVFEEAAHGVGVFGGEVDDAGGAGGGGGGELGAGVEEEGGLREEGLVRGEGGGVVALANVEFDNGGFEVAGGGGESGGNFAR